MKTIFLCTSLLFVVAFGAGPAAAQRCDRYNQSPIRCGFYDEGFQDGEIDARAGQSSDYRRYRLKFNSQYESYYRDGYNAGYDSVRPTTRWTSSQRRAYDSGYSIGQSDRRSGGQSRAAVTPGSYDQSIALYFQQGYYDGFNNRPRTYDVPITGDADDPFPGPGGRADASWSGRVDGTANIEIRGRTIRTTDASDTGLQVFSENIRNALPRRAVNVSARRIEGRGDVRVIQQPSRFNDFTAIVQIDDPRAGADSYRVEMSWAGSGFDTHPDEPYRSGSVRWRGRVDQTVNIVISGIDVQSIDDSGTGLSGVSHDITGTLARRPGSVTVRKRSGRGSVTVLQQPSRDNDYTAIIQIFDPSSGSDDYEIDISW